MTIDWVFTTIGSLIVLGAGAYFGWLAVRGDKSASNAIELYKALMGDVKELRVTVKDLNARVTRQGAWISQASEALQIADRQVRGYGGVPQWHIDPFVDEE